MKDYIMTKQMKYCHSMVKELLGREHTSYAWPFYKPINAEALELSDYYDVIKKPMDLETVKANLEKGVYSTPDEFAIDMRLIFMNCFTYNPPELEVCNQARLLQDVFEKMFADMPDESVPPESFESAVPSGSAFSDFALIEAVLPGGAFSFVPGGGAPKEDDTASSDSFDLFTILAHRDV